MIYKSYADLARDVYTFSNRCPRFDTVVGIPRSGMLVAGMLAKIWDVPACSVESFTGDESKALLIDDSYGTGATMRKYAGRAFKRAAIYSTIRADGILHCYVEETPLPRLFEWNIFRHPHWLLSSCWDVDGLLCRDPTDEENDDGPRYAEFLRTATPWVKPANRVGAIVTARFEKYRPQTQEWLARNGIEYNCLIMSKRSSVADRRGNHAVDKADYYGGKPWKLFYESDPDQAAKIHAITRKPVYCPASGTMHHV